MRVSQEWRQPSKLNKSRGAILPHRKQKRKRVKLTRNAKPKAVTAPAVATPTVAVVEHETYLAVSRVHPLGYLSLLEIEDIETGTASNIEGMSYQMKWTAEQIKRHAITAGSRLTVVEFAEVSPVETAYVDKSTGEIVALARPRVSVSFVLTSVKNVPMSKAVMTDRTA